MGIYKKICDKEVLGAALSGVNAEKAFRCCIIECLKEFDVLESKDKCIRFNECVKNNCQAFTNFSFIHNNLVDCDAQQYPTPTPIQKLE